MKTQNRSSNVRWILLGLFLWMTMAVIAFVARNAHATPSTVMWAPSTPYLQPYGVMHVTYDTYFGSSAIYPIDTGLTMGVLPGQKLQAEVGFDLFYSTLSGGEGVKAPFVLNGKVGAPEDVYFRGQPAWSAGIFGVGFEEDVNDANVLYFMLGKTLALGVPTLGVYYGTNENLFRSSTGEEERFGVLAGWTSPAMDVALIDKVTLCADVQTGNNALGGAGFGVSAYFTPSIALLTGPVFFLEKELQPGGTSWMWSVQLDVDLDLNPNPASSGK
jgi:hypothetical protein